MEDRVKKYLPPIRQEDEFFRGTTSVYRFLAENGLNGYGREPKTGKSIPCLC